MVRARLRKILVLFEITIFEVVLRHPCEVAIPLIARKSYERTVALHA
jgi:hypothetical protein